MKSAFARLFHHSSISKMVAPHPQHTCCLFAQKPAQQDFACTTLFLWELPGCVSIGPISAYRNWSLLTHPDDGTRPVLRGSAVRLVSSGMTIGADLRDVVKQVGCRSVRIAQTEQDLTL